GGAWRTDVVRAVANGQGVEIDGRRASGFRLTSERPIQLNGREYPAALEVLKNGDGLAVVNELPLEDYLVGVVRAEAGERWPREMLRAQAIVARTYAAYHRVLNAPKAYHILASTVHQGYAGHVPSSSPVWDAVRDTSRRVLLWDGDLFPAFYHAASGGYTGVPRTVFAAGDVAVDGETARFAGRGFGHGVGMSQWGAKAMAERGYRAEKILEYYYPGMTLGSLDDLERTLLRPPTVVPASRGSVE